MQQYLITVWEDGRKWSYLMGSTNIEAYKKHLKEKHNRILVEERGIL